MNTLTRIWIHIHTWIKHAHEYTQKDAQKHMVVYTHMDKHTHMSTERHMDAIRTCIIAHMDKPRT